MPEDTQMDTKLLDRIAATRAQAIVDTAVDRLQGPTKKRATAVDNLVTKALGVFQENGVYAGFLFLFSRTRDQDETIAKAVREQLLDLAAEDLPFDWGKPDDMSARTALRHVSGTICAELDPLLMTKEVFEQTLIYARYGAKSRKNDGKGD
jgi:hypothetical protein